jgi:hypothetical protein
VLGALVGVLTDREGPRTPDRAFGMLADRVPAYGGISYEDLNHSGALVNETSPVAGD